MIHIFRECGKQEFSVDVSNVSTHIGVLSTKACFVSFAHNQLTGKKIQGEHGMMDEKTLPNNMGEYIKQLFHDYWVDPNVDFLGAETDPIYLRFNPKNFKPFYKFSSGKPIAATPVELVFATLSLPKGFKLINRYMKYITIGAVHVDEEQELVDIIFSYPVAYMKQMSLQFSLHNAETGEYIHKKFICEDNADKTTASTLRYYCDVYAKGCLPNNAKFKAVLTNEAIKSDKPFDLGLVRPRIISNLVLSDQYDFKDLKNRLFEELHGAKKFTKIIILNNPTSHSFYEKYVKLNYVHTVTIAVNVASDKMEQSIRDKYAKQYKDFQDVNYLCSDNKIVY